MASCEKKNCTKEMSNLVTITPANSNEIKQDFYNLFPKLREQLLVELKQNFQLTQEFEDYMNRLWDHTLKGGKLFRAINVVDTYREVKKEEQVPSSTYERLMVVGWCIEFLQAFFLVADDIMDQSLERRGVPCWYRVDDVRLGACNDFIMLESQLFRLLKFYFKGEPELYYKLLDLFQLVTYQTEMGQLYDTRSQLVNRKETDISRFTMDRYKTIVKFKTAYYTYYLPVAAGLLLSGFTDLESYTQSKELCLAIGEYFQIQDDYLDCYGRPEVLGKIGRDIEEAKCCWLVVRALEKNYEKAAPILKAHYGKDDAESVKIVKQLYEELEIEKEYQAYEQSVQDFISTRIKTFDEFGINPSIFEKMLNQIKNRKK